MSTAVVSTAVTDPRFESVYDVLRKAIAEQAFPGCAFGVFSRGQVVLLDALGRFTYEEDAPRVEPGTVFDLASVSKVVATTAMAMLLFQRGQLDVDAPLGSILPQFVANRAQDAVEHTVTLRHLLAHNSGLAGYVEFFRTTSNAAQLLQTCYSLNLQASPGSRYEYSDPGFILLGKALEKLAGVDLQTFFTQEIAAPLGLTTARYCPPEVEKSKIPPTEVDTWFRHRRIQGEVQDENACLLGGICGHAGLFANTADLMRFSAEVLEAARAGGQPKIFAPETLQFFAKKQAPEGSSRALGWDTPSLNSSSGQYYSVLSLGHLGYSGCSLWIDLEAQVAIALLTNRTWPDRGSQKIKILRPLFHDAARGALF
ncbi:serine hydrolase domain-containing protein [Telmatobacter bradus]|uniref:serine hydrolase domain-containing protein n=1 Tax=Telmatobacter bradus TaxID=474953 RepID=UPI003B43C365